MTIPAPNIPTLSTKVDNDVRRAFDAIKNWLSAISADGGIVTQASLPEDLSASAIAISALLDGTTPPLLLNLSVLGAFRTIMLDWDDPHTANLSYVEVWRHTADNLGSAQMVGTTISALYVDIPPNASMSVDYYYWVRAISPSGLKGPFNATAGTKGNTANDPAYMIDIISKSLDTVTPTANAVDMVFAAERFAVRMAADSPDTFEYPFIVAQIPGSSPAQYAVFIDTGFIKDGTITNAKIASAAIDNAKIADATISSAKIADAAITNAKIGDSIQSTVYVPGPGGIGWKIDKAGTIVGQGLIVEDASITNAKIANATITAAKIGDAQIDTLRLAGNSVIIPAGSTADWGFGTAFPGGWSSLLPITIYMPYAGTAICTATLSGQGSGVGTVSGYFYTNVIQGMMRILSSTGAATGAGIVVQKVATFNDSGNSNYNSLGFCVSVTLKESLPAGYTTYYLQSWGDGTTAPKLGCGSIVVVGAMR